VDVDVEPLFDNSLTFGDFDNCFGYDENNALTSTKPEPTIEQEESDCFVPSDEDDFDIPLPKRRYKKRLYKKPKCKLDQPKKSEHVRTSVSTDLSSKNINEKNGEKPKPRRNRICKKPKVKWVQRNPNRLPCPHCSITFTKEYLVQNHVRAKHLGKL